MRKKILITVSIVLIIIFAVYNVGFQFGKIAIGRQHDDIEVNSKYDIKNSKFSKNYLQDGEISVITLWASWCKPCIDEIPIFNKLKKDFPNIKFATLSIDKDSNKLIKSIESNHVINDITLENSEYRKAIRNLLENRDLKSLIKTEIVPITYIIKNNKVIYKEEGQICYEEFSKKLNSIK